VPLKVPSSPTRLETGPVSWRVTEGAVARSQKHAHVVAAFVGRGQNPLPVLR